MKKFSLVILSISLQMLCCISARTAYPAILEAIEAGNPELRALRGETDAAIAESMGGLNLPDPEVNFSYMWGQEENVPDKINVSVMQSFDFATISGARKKVAKSSALVAEAQYLDNKSSIMLEAEKALINYTYCSEICNELQRQLAEGQAMRETAAKALELGQITILDYNKIELEVLARSNELSIAKTDLESAARQIALLAGGSVDLSSADKWPTVFLPSSFDDFLAGSLEADSNLGILRAETARTDKEISLRKREGLPSFSAGYVNELVRDANYNGFAVGLSLPLWSNHGRVKAAKAAHNAALLRMETATEKLRTELRDRYDRAATLAKAADSARSLYERICTTNTEYLRKAIDQGTITVLEYMTEQEDFYSHALKVIEIERDYRLALADLYAPLL